MDVKIWVDDIREPPGHKWTWIKTSRQAIEYLDVIRRTGAFPLSLMSLDHDLGGEDTTRPIVLWMCENEFWPDEVVVHSANPVGRDWLEGMISRYKS